MGSDQRTYITVHDGMPDHPKIAGLSDRAFRLLIETWCWCSRHLTDGVVPVKAWNKRGTKAARDELRAVGLTEDHPEGVYMRDYLQHQRSRAQIEAIKKARREAGALGGAASARSKRLSKSLSKTSSEFNPEVREQITDTENIEEPRTLTPSGDGFDEFWKQYPTRINGGSKGSRKNALAVWKRLSPAKKAKALSSLPIYAKAKNGYPKDAERYLRSEEWEGLENVVSIPESEYQWL